MPVSQTTTFYGNSHFDAHSDNYYYMIETRMPPCSANFPVAYDW